MLYLIGLGLHDEKDVSVKAIEIAKKCACYCELYTNKWYGSLEELGNMIGKKVQLLQRSDLEENLKQLINTAKETDVALFVPGDPLAATTHVEVVVQARKEGIPIEIIHNASIFSAIAESGLQLYKFGKTATIPFTKHLESVKEAVNSNKGMGLHTLLLLDLDSVNDKYMSVSEALELLMSSDILNEHDKVVAMAKLGSGEPEIFYDEAGPLHKKVFSVPAVLIVPGKLHFLEKDYLEMLK
ncbi:MAG: diphthine synthase [Candidatus Aenigmarchaeota archaeon]|nr:diphthine synthase [Candidatus Aenigmarchaeota archaeon]